MGSRYKPVRVVGTEDVYHGVLELVDHPHIVVGWNYYVGRVVLVEGEWIPEQSYVSRHQIRKTVGSALSELARMTRGLSRTTRKRGRWDS